MSGREATDFAPGLHVAAGQAANVSAYGWAVVSPLCSRGDRRCADSTGQRALDVSTGTGEAALLALPAVSASGTVIGADIAPAMLVVARDRLADPLFYPVAADGQALPFMNGAFDAVICQLGLQFFPDPARGLAEFCRVLKPGCRAAVCVISTHDKAPMFGVLADVLSRFVPQQRDFLHLSFALADANRLERMFVSAGFHEVRVERVQHKDVITGYDEYWSPIETGMGSQPQIYVSLSEADRCAVREEVNSRLSPLLSNGRLVMRIEMLIASGRVVIIATGLRLLSSVLGHPIVAVSVRHGKEEADGEASDHGKGGADVEVEGASQFANRGLRRGHRRPWAPLSFLVRRVW